MSINAIKDRKIEKNFRVHLIRDADIAKKDEKFAIIDDDIVIADEKIWIFGGDVVIADEKIQIFDGDVVVAGEKLRSSMAKVERSIPVARLPRAPPSPRAVVQPCEPGQHVGEGHDRVHVLIDDAGR